MIQTHSLVGFTGC
uniref:Heat shock protein 82-like n=1 Tax=Rhizophora mucronata TaxID=61149 RepID=A0A2P2NU10_RHIMU